MNLRHDAEIIIQASIQAVLPDEAVSRALENKKFDSGKLFLVAAGKAAWQMAYTTEKILSSRLDGGIVISKYNHIKSPIPKLTCIEAGHPIPDENSFRATEAAIQLVRNLTAKDTVIFLLSGGASALFEKPLIPSEELADITNQLLSCGADIVEMNTLRKRLSAVKGGKFARLCEPAHIYCIVLSDIIGDPLDMIASGPVYPDSSTCEQALRIAHKYNLKLSAKAWDLLKTETIKNITNVETIITGNVHSLCEAAAISCASLGYRPIILSDQLTCEAREAGSFLASIARTHRYSNESLAFIVGGETVVHITGKGKGGRNQELALAAAPFLSGIPNAVIFSVGSDGTDGPTEAAGGYVDSKTCETLKQNGLNVYDILKENNSYHALKLTNGLIITGATGTNVNDFSVLLIRKL
ncbi:MAG: DUF4147 domain-containing protein [Eubacteriales bacterium]|nr:DUF4147 domain-containing protein [Eubacteriales bacterium]